MHGSLAPDLLLSRDGRTQPAAAQATVLLIDGRPLMRECLARGIRAEWPEVRLAVAGWSELAASAGSGVALCLVSLAGGGSLETVRSLLPDTRRSWSSARTKAIPPCRALQRRARAAISPPRPTWRFSSRA